MAGDHHEHRGDRARQVRDRRPALHARRDAARRKRLAPHASRDRDPRQPRVGDREQEPGDGPGEVRRRVQRRADRLGGAGVRPQDRQADPNLGRARSHPPERLPRLGTDQRLPMGRLPRQRDRPAQRRNVRRLHAEHLGRLQGQHRDRQDRVDARGQALELQVRQGRRFPVAARRGGVSRVPPCHPLRQPLLPDHRRRHVRSADRVLARTGAEGRPGHPHRHACRSVQPRQGFRQRLHGQHRALAESERVRRVGIEPLLLRVRRLGSAAPGRQAPGAEPQLPREA